MYRSHAILVLARRYLYLKGHYDAVMLHMHFIVLANLTYDTYRPEKWCQFTEICLKIAIFGILKQTKKNSKCGRPTKSWMD